MIRTFLSVGLWMAAVPVVFLWSATATAADDPSPAPAHVAKDTAKDGNTADTRTTTQKDKDTDSALLKKLGQMLDHDWKDRPEWAEMAVAILKGEKMRIGVGWWRLGSKRYDWNWLRERFDADSDGRILPSELAHDAKEFPEFFERLDLDASGEITEADFDHTDRPPTNRAGRIAMIAGYLFYRLDKNSNGRLSQEEILQFFADADRDDAGYLTPEDMRFALDDPSDRDRREDSGPTPSEMLDRLLSGQLGWFDPGPQLGDPAPDFILPTHDGQTLVGLSSSEKPVVLVFGSFT